VPGEERAAGAPAGTDLKPDALKPESNLLQTGLTQQLACGSLTAAAQQT